MARIDQAAGLENPLQKVFPQPIVSVRAPTAADKKFPLGQEWVDSTNSAVYFLTAVVAGSATWALASPGASDVDTLTGDSGGAISPMAGNITLAGTAGQITTTGSGDTITWTLPAAVTAPGSLATTTTLTGGTGITATTGGVTATAGGVTATAGDITATAGDVIATAGDITATAGAVSAGTTVTGGTGITATTGGVTATAGGVTATAGDITATAGDFVLTAEGGKVNHTSVATTTTAGANSIGSVTLVNGTATVATSSVNTASLIKIWRQSIGSTGAAATGNLTVGTITDGVSFVITAVQAADATAAQTTDVSVIGWEIVN